MKIILLLLFLTLYTMSSSSRIPTAIPVDELDHDIKNIKKNIGKIMENVDKANNALTGLNVFNIIALQSGVNDLGVQINKLKTHNQNMEKLNGLISEFNKLLKPISDLASNKIAASEIEARIKEKEFNLKMAEIRARKENIDLWDAYQLNINEKSVLNYELMVTVPIIVCLSTIMITKSYL